MIGLPKLPVGSATNRRRILRERRGAMLVFVAVSMVALLGMLSLAMDVGAGNRERRIAQTAADAGAIGGAAEIYRMQSNAVISAAAFAEAARNGYAASYVNVYNPPITGPHTGDNQYVEVTIAKTIPSIFGGIFNINSLNVASRAVAGVGSYSLICLYSLDPSGDDAIKVDNGGLVTANCGASINSSSANALDLNQSGQFDGNGAIGIVGGWTGNKTPDPAPSTGATAVQDPLSYIQMPVVGACTRTGLLTISKDTVLNPGVYCGGINISDKTATLNPGTYIMLGGGLTVGTSGSIVGSGVTLVNTFNTTYAFAPFNFGTGCKATLSAPTTGSLKGILMFGDPADPPSVAPSTNINVFSCASDSNPELTGALYFPSETLLFNGSNSGTQVQGAIIAKDLEVSGKLTMINDTSSGTALKRMSLVE